MTKPYEMLRPVPFDTERRPKGLGRVFYVNTYGTNVNDSNAGTDPDQPLQKIETAIAKCTAGKNDYIFVQDVWDADTMPITINKAAVHIVGLSHSPLPIFATVAVGGDTPSFEIGGAGHHVEIAGFALGGGGSGGAIEFLTGGSYGQWIHDNLFGSVHPGAETPLYGIEYNVGGGDYSVIEDNVFLGDGMNSGLIDGIAILLKAGMGIIRRNTFRNISAVNISYVSGQGFEICNNKFSLNADTTGLAITLSAAILDAYVHDNDAQFGDTDAMGNVPYSDGAAGDANNWARNTAGAATVVYPA